MSFFMTINGKRVQASEGEMVLAVARRAGAKSARKRKKVWPQKRRTRREGRRP